MHKVYADQTLGYDPEETFKLPDGFDPCKDFSISGDSIIDEPESGLDDLFN